MKFAYKSIGWILLVCFVRAEYCYCATPANPQQQALWELFLSNVAKSEDVPMLERAACSIDESDKLIPSDSSLPNFWHLRVADLRGAAYARLGELHTKDSLAAVERIENKAKQRTPARDDVSLTLWWSPDSGKGKLQSLDTVQMPDGRNCTMVTIKTSDGLTYGVIRGVWLMGEDDLFLTSTKTPEEKSGWSRPKLIPGGAPTSITEASLNVKSDGVLEFAALTMKVVNKPSPDGGKPIRETVTEKSNLEIPIKKVLEDQDGDGWTDAEELRLGLDPRKKDTDGDGIEDGKDCCPLFAPPPGYENNEEARILEKALFAAFGAIESRELLVVDPKSAKAQAWGVSAPVIYLDDVDKWRNEHGNRLPVLEWTVSRTGDEAKVEFTGASVSEVRLRKIDGKWIVVKRIPKGMA
jgi:hypothetical protein